MARILTADADIRQWAESHAGYPMMADLPGVAGKTQTLLQITFGQHALNAENNEGPDRLNGFQLTSWDDWLAELRNQKLALHVQSDAPGGSTNFEFVPAEGNPTGDTV